eukprot:3797002-Amphidinium_carterae.1
MERKKLLLQHDFNRTCQGYIKTSFGHVKVLLLRTSDKSLQPCQEKSWSGRRFYYIRTLNGHIK